MKNKGVLIFLGILFISVLGIAIYINYSNNKPRDNYSKLQPVKEHITFFTVSNNVNNYLKIISEKRYDKLYELLDDRYLKKNKITEENIEIKMPEYDNLLDISVKEMNYVDIDNSSLYVVKGDLLDNSIMDETTIVQRDFYIIVIMDYDNYTVAFYPTSEDYKEDINSINNGIVGKGDYNSYVKGNLISTENICSMYLNDLLINSAYDGNRIYNNLDSRVKDYITSGDELNNYLDNVSDKIDTNINSCEVERLDDYNIYYIYDSKGNYYEFTEYSVLNYKVYFEIK